MNVRRIPILVCCLLVGGAAFGAAQENDKGETPAQKKLRGRATAPTAAEVDASVTLAAMLEKKDKGALSEAKGATVEGWVIQVEREQDGDYHLALAPTAGETDSKNWVIVEVTPTWQKKDAALSGDSVRKLHGKKVRVTGWLYYEPDDESHDPRGTLWEIHPVTSIQAAP